MADSVRQAPSVALLGRDDAVRAQLRHALDELGANLVYEGELRGADPSAVAATQPAVVLLNLDAGGEDALDGLDSLLIDPSMRVVFNEAETTAALSGWDLARWARHLAAKVLGHDRTIPPPPEGAEGLPEVDLMPVPGAPPTPESQADPLSMATMQDEANRSIDAVPASARLVPEASHVTDEVVLTSTAADLAPSSEDNLEINHDEIALALSGLPEDAPSLRDLRESDSATGAMPQIGSDREGPSLADPALEEMGIDLSEFEAALGELGGESAAFEEPGEVSPASSSQSGSLEAELEALALQPFGDEFEHEGSSTISGDHGGDAGTTGPVIRLDFASDVGDAAESGELDEAVAALAAQLEAMEERAPPGEVQVRDPDFFFDIAADEAPEAIPEKRAKAIDLGSSLSLEDDAAESRKAEPTRRVEAPSIDTSALSLEPLPDPGLLVAPTKVKKPEEEPYLPRPGIDLMLAPLQPPPEDEDAPAASPRHAAVKADIGESFDLAGLALEPLPGDEDAIAFIDSGSGGIQRVIVLGASIGGPDALRSFLGGLPADFPALLVLAQHLESGFFDRLAQQLQKISKLPIRVANDDRKVKAGEVLVIPSGERVRVQPNGSVQREPHATPTHYRPCIDDVMRDIADAFGPKATAIIFSGMAGDAVEGAVYLTSKGGEVWVQDPASCVVSSMVDGAQARGVVEFSGSPRELAEHCVARFGRK